MPPADRNNPKRAKSSESQYSLMEFMQDFPDDATCLNWLWQTRYAHDGEHAYCPKCEVERSFKRYTTSQQRQSWTCTSCGHHIHPTAGTIFHKSSTSLHLWFYAIYLMTSTRCGISAKQLEREVGVTYKTAWRMFHLIRNELMTTDGTPLSGEVEVDETLIGGKPRAGQIKNKSESRAFVERKAKVFAMVERGGQVRAMVVPDRKVATLGKHMQEHILPSSMIYTDDWKGYRGVGRQYAGHKRVNHTAKVYVDGDATTNTIEGFFGLVKNGIRGVYHAVSAKHLQGYLSEYVFRYNHQDDGHAMFLTLLLRAARP